MASKGGKGSKSSRGAAAEPEEVEEDGTAATGVTPEVFRRLPMGVHRYDPINPPVPSLRSRRGVSQATTGLLMGAVF